jgi:hypothetical protein
MKFAKELEQDLVPGRSIACHKLSINRTTVIIVTRARIPLTSLQNGALNTSTTRPVRNASRPSLRPLTAPTTRPAALFGELTAPRLAQPFPSAPLLPFTRAQEHRPGRPESKTMSIHSNVRRRTSHRGSASRFPPDDTRNSTG